MIIYVIYAEYAISQYWPFYKISYTEMNHYSLYVHHECFIKKPEDTGGNWIGMLADVSLKKWVGSYNLNKSYSLQIGWNLIYSNEESILSYS